MKKNNKKGFTIVELVIVIAVIAILAAVLIPTFSNVIAKAQKSAAMQAARNEYEMYLAEYAKDLDGTQNLVIVKGDYYFEVENGQFKSDAKDYKGEIKTTYDAKVDLSQVFVAEEVADTATFGANTYYTLSKGIYTAVPARNEAGTGTGKTTYYKLASPAADLGNKDVAIYAAE